MTNDHADIKTLITNLNRQVSKVQEGDTQRIELMLMTQAQTLDAIFHKLIKSAFKSGCLDQMQAYADIALKAQNQSRKALLALAEIMHPKRTTFIKQQNNAVNQQINNTAQPENSKKSKKRANELLEVSHGAVDITTPITPSTAHPAMETMVKSRRQNSRGKSD